MLDFAVRLAKKAGEHLKEHLHDEITIEHKGRIDLVTNLDRQSQDMIVSAVQRTWPDHGIIAEEAFSKKGSSPYTWVIDPLDGTNNFIHRIPFFCVAIGILKEGRPHIGACYNPLLDEMYWAQAGHGAFCNGAALRVSRTARMIDSLIATGFPYDQDTLDVLVARFSRVLSRARGIRRLGSAALDLCMVARGSLDAFWEEGLKPWDMAAGIAILAEAGGVVCGIDGGELDLWRGDIIGSNGRVHEELLRCLNDEHD